MSYDPTSAPPDESELSAEEIDALVDEAERNAKLPTTFRALTDSGNAELFAEMFRESVRYCAPMKSWLVYDGTRWAIDRVGAVELLAKQAVRAIAVQAAKASDDDVRKAMLKWAIKSESANARAALLKLARSEDGIAVKPEQLDADPWLLNTPTGTIELRTGVMREHRREDLITQRTAARYEPGARSALWESVLAFAFGGDDELVAFFQRACGYSLTGSTAEEKLIVAIGPTRTGKSTIMQAFRKALGDYARTADFEAFVTQKNAGGPKNEIARLAGARLVVSVEVDKGRRLAQGLVKTITGGDVVTARFLFQEAFEFDPQFKLWLVANDAPHVPDDDEAMWARILRIPFMHRPAVGDPAVKLELCDVERSGAAILAWALEGCMQWQAKGLGAPRAVLDATAAYRAEEDPLREFFADACTVDPAVSCTRSSLRAAYEVWASEAGGRVPLTGAAFNDRVRRLAGVTEKTRKGVRWWHGVGLLATPTMSAWGRHAEAEADS